MLSRLHSHHPFVDVKVVAAHGSVVYSSCLQIAFHIAAAKWTTINKCLLGRNAPVADAKLLSAHPAVVYWACTHPARYYPVTKWTYVSEQFGVSLLFSESFAGCIGLLRSVFFSFAFLVCLPFPGLW